MERFAKPEKVPWRLFRKAVDAYCKSELVVTNLYTTLHFLLDNHEVHPAAKDAETRARDLVQVYEEKYTIPFLLDSICVRMKDLGPNAREVLQKLPDKELRRLLASILLYIYSRAEHRPEHECEKSVPQLEHFLQCDREVACCY